MKAGVCRLLNGVDAFLPWRIAVEETELLPILDVAGDEDLGVLGVGACTACALIGDEHLGVIDDLQPLLADARAPVEVLGIHEEAVVEPSCELVGFP